MAAPTASGGAEEMPAHGLHRDRPAPGLGKAEVLFSMLPFLSSMLSQLPGLACGFGFGMFLFFVYWGRDGVANEVYTHLPFNTAVVALMSVVSSVYQGARDRATVKKQAKQQYTRGCEETEILYRAPRLD